MLLVASRYPNHAAPLWNLPGGRVRPDETYGAAVARELAEETGLSARATTLRYVSESHDAATGTRFVNVTFAVDVAAEATAVMPRADAHVAALDWVARAELETRLSVRVVREPLLANLADPSLRYFAFGDAGITIEFADGP